MAIALPSGRIRHHGRRKRQVLEYVETTISKDGTAPSYGMIERDLGMRNRSDVHRVIVCLERDGCLRRTGTGRVRRIRLTKNAN